MNEDLSKVTERLGGADPCTCRVVTGFDGFVDEMITLVGERHDLNDFTPVQEIATFGSLIFAAAGHSSLREIVINDVHPGGCAVNLADGLASLGAGVDCFATLGVTVHPTFGEIGAKCHGFHSWGCEPGRTLAFEFNDGKMMFSAVRQLADFTPDAVRGFLADGHFAAACARAQVIALTDWTLYPHMTEVWKNAPARGVFQTHPHAGVLHRPRGSIEPLRRGYRGVAAILCRSENGIFIMGETPEHVSDIRFDNVRLELYKTSRRPSDRYHLRPCEPSLQPTGAEPVGPVSDCGWESRHTTSPIFIENEQDITFYHCSVVDGIRSSTGNFTET